MQCPVCNHKTKYFLRDRETDRVFFRCETCFYIFSIEHEFDSDGARDYFRRQWQDKPDGANPRSYPLFYTLLESAGKTSATALDFGCGNGAFIRYLRGKEIEALGVDPIHVDNDMSPYVYSSLDDLSEKRFDVITAFEVFEHLDRPHQTISELLSHLEENEFVYITTALTNRALTSIRCFQHWIYQKDPTHIGFFHERTFEWLAARYGLEIQVFRYDSVVLDRSFERLVDIQNNGFVFREVKESHILHKPGPF